MDVNRVLKKRNISFFVNILITLVSIFVVLLLMTTSSFLSSVLDGYKKVVFYAIIIFGVIFNTIYLLCYLLIKISVKEACYLTVAGTKHEEEFYDEFMNEDKTKTSDNDDSLIISVEEIKNDETDVENLENINNIEEEPKREKYKLSNKGKLFLVLSNIGELYMVVAVAFLVVALIFSYLLFPATVQGDCMQPLLYGQTYSYKGDKIVAFKTDKVENGKVIVFEYDYDIQAVGSVKDNELLVKRVIASPGQRFECINGVIYIDGEALEEEYVKYPYGSLVNYTLNKIIRYNTNFESMNYDDSNIVPDGYYVVLGDNRRVANDSHYFGLVHESQICGVVKYCINESGWNKVE